MKSRAYRSTVRATLKNKLFNGSVQKHVHQITVFSAFIASLEITEIAVDVLKMHYSFVDHFSFLGSLQHQFVGGFLKKKKSLQNLKGSLM